jgi:hypothetical protein
MRDVHPGKRIPDPDLDFFPSRTPDPGSGSATLVESHRKLEDAKTALDMAEQNDYSTCRPLSYLENSTLHPRYPKYSIK